MYDITVKDSSLEEKHDWHEYKLWKNINTTINFFFLRKFLLIIFVKFLWLKYDQMWYNLDYIYLFNRLYFLYLCS